MNLQDLTEKYHEAKHLGDQVETATERLLEKKEKLALSKVLSATDSYTETCAVAELKLIKELIGYLHAQKNIAQKLKAQIDALAK